MFRTVIAGLTAVSLTLTTAAPAQAENLNEEQVGQLLFGLLATGVIAAMISDLSDRADPEPVQSPQTWNPRPNRPRIDPPRHEQPRHPRGNRDRFVVPSQCVVSHVTRFGDVRMFGRACMRQNYRHVAQLPEACSVRVVTRQGPRNGWDPQCLRSNGYEASNRRRR